MSRAASRLGLAALLCIYLATPSLSTSLVDELDDSRPIRKVITLLEEMKQQVEVGAKEDKTAYDKYMCWCQTNEQEKSDTVKAAEQQISELTTFIEESAAREGALKTEIAGLEDDIASDKDALATATSVREKEHAAFLAEEADMKETRHLLAEAIKVLAKVQLVQKHGKAPAEAKKAAAMLVQVKSVIGLRFPQFSSILQKDLFDVLGSFDGLAQAQAGAFLPKRHATVLEQSKLLPWEKTEEQIGMEANPNDLEGHSAGSKSYNSRSGGIVGILAEMEDEFTRDLSNSQKTDFQAEVDFQSLRAAKLAEIAVASKQKEQKEASLADNLNDAAKAKADKESTEAAVEADQGFLLNLEKNCKTEDEEYKGRVAVRTEELRALTETLKILNEDVSRDLYEKTMGFVQLRMKRSVAVSAQRAAFERSVRRIAEVARRHRNWALASLASHLKLDAFTKVKIVMDKMLAELEQQQKDEYAKWEMCKKNIDETEDSIKVGEQTKADLAEKHKKHENTIATLLEEIASLKEDVANMEMSLKQAGEERKEENELYQTQVTDQRATIAILQKATQRLKMFYEFNQVSSHSHARVPGAAVAPPPPTPKDYQKSAGAGGVLQLMAMIIKDAEVAEQELAQNEQTSQQDYSNFVQSATASIEADRASISQKEALTAQTKAAKSETEEFQLANGEELAKLGDLLKAHHLECDYVIKYFDLRQKARAEEMDSIKDAKAILSGSKFGQ